MKTMLGCLYRYIIHIPSDFVQWRKKRDRDKKENWRQREGGDAGGGEGKGMDGMAWNGTKSPKLPSSQIILSRAGAEDLPCSALCRK